MAQKGGEFHLLNAQENLGWARGQVAHLTGYLAHLLETYAAESTAFSELEGLKARIDSVKRLLTEAKRNVKTAERILKRVEEIVAEMRATGQDITQNMASLSIGSNGDAMEGEKPVTPIEPVGPQPP